MFHDIFKKRYSLLERVKKKTFEWLLVKFSFLLGWLCEKLLFPIAGNYQYFCFRKKKKTHKRVWSSGTKHFFTKFVIIVLGNLLFFCKPFFMNCVFIFLKSFKSIWKVYKTTTNHPQLLTHSHATDSFQDSCYPGLTLHSVRRCSRRSLYVTWKVREALTRYAVRPASPTLRILSSNSGRTLEQAGAGLRTLLWSWGKLNDLTQKSCERV